MIKRDTGTPFSTFFAVPYTALRAHEIERIHHIRISVSSYYLLVTPSELVFDEITLLLVASCVNPPPYEKF